MDSELARMKRKFYLRRRDADLFWSMWRVLKFILLFRILFGRAEIQIEKIEQMGLLAVKIAQMYAVRSDILGVEKCMKLQALFEQVTPISWEVVQGVLRAEAPDSFWEEVVNIDHDHLATASLGQVHLAELRSGEKVVVKVVKPEATLDFESDLKAVRMIIRAAVTFYPKLKRLADPMGTIETIARLTRKELDLLNESIGAERMRELRKRGQNLPHLQRLHFPKYYNSISSKQVLVSEWIGAESVRSGLDQNSFGYDNLLSLFRIHGFYMFLHGEFHGDLHPGNVFFEGDKFWFIDNANVEVVPSDFTQGLLRFLAQLGARDFSGAARVMQEISKNPPKDQDKYYREFAELYSGFQSGVTSLTTQMMQTVKLCVHAGMEFPEGAFPVIKSLMYLDGMALKCNPEAKLLEDVLHYMDDLT